MTQRKKSRTPAKVPVAETPPSEPRTKKSKRTGASTPIDPSPVVVPAPPTPAPPVLPSQSPEDAALEAARIVSEIIDIETPTGAVIAAAAAAGAAMEVRRANEGGTMSDGGVEALSTTGKLSRDKILAAIAAEEDADKAADARAAAGEPPAPTRNRRAATEPGIPKESTGDFAPTRNRRAATEPGIPASRESTPIIPRRAATDPGIPRRAATDPGSRTEPGSSTRSTSTSTSSAPSQSPTLTSLGPTSPSPSPSPIDSASETAATGEPAIVGEAPIPPPEAGPADEAQYDEEFDPVQIAAAAIQRLRKRARTDLAELRGHYNRLDGLVIVLAFIIIVVVGRIHADLVTPPNVVFSKRGLTFEHSQTWLSPEPIAFSSPRIVRDLNPTASQKAKDPEKDPYHVEFTSTLDPAARIEVLIDKKPQWSNIVSALDLDRRTRFGELYKLDASSVVDVEGHDWLRTEYTFAHAPQKGDAPRVDRAIEYSTKDKDQLYVLTFFGSPKELERIEEVVAPSLRVATNVGLQLEAQTTRLARQNYPKPVGLAFESTVMIVVADLVDGRLRVKGGGSGVIVGGDGSILTAYHVIHDKDGRLHDVFVIGRFGEADQPPYLMCAGRPSRSKLQREVDLALVKCDMDLDGRAWIPTSAPGVWQTLPEGHTTDIKMGQRLWVLGYPDAGGGGLTLSQGEVDGWTGIDGAQGRDYIKTDASIRSGNSGGPVIDDSGKLVGIAAAFRTRVNLTSVTELTQVGLVRPLSTASDLLAIAAAGWTPREGHTDVELAPVAVEAPAEGVHLSTKILDAANEAPIDAALVMILRKGVSSDQVDVNRLDDQVLSWGRSNSQGEVLLKQPVPTPGTYSVLVIARGYEPLIGKEALTLPADTPSSFDPWGQIWLRSR